MFKHAKENSPAKSIDLVVACAGITSADPIYFGQGQFVLHPLCQVQETDSIRVY